MKKVLKKPRMNQRKKIKMKICQVKKALKKPRMNQRKKIKPKICQVKKVLKKPRMNQRKKMKPKICQVEKMIVHPMKVGVMKKTKIIHINRIGENTDGNKYKCTKCNYR